MKTLDAVNQAVALSQRDAQALRSRAAFLVKIGDTKGALADLKRALSSSTAKADTQFRASLFYMGAWASMISGDNDEARESMERALAADPALESIRPVLEFRLITEEQGRKEAYAYALNILATPDTPRLTEELLTVMIGSKDFRDIRYESEQQRSDYALYLSGYRMERDPGEGLGAAKSPASEAIAAEAPVIVLGDSESVGADVSAQAIVRLAYRDALIKEGSFRVVDSDSRRTAVEELELSLSDAAAGQRDQALGQLFSADYVASGSVVQSDAGWLVAYTLSSSEDGTILANEFASAPDHAAVQALASRFAASLGCMARTGRLCHKKTAALP